MVRSLLIRGMLVGALAGVLAFAVAYLVGEPQVQAAIDFEAAAAARAGEAGGEELVSRDVQRTLGLLTGTLAIGVAAGGFFALVYAFAYGRLAAVTGARATAGVMAVAGFVVVSLVPFTKYPSNPPAVSSDGTLDRRTLLFFAMVAVSALAALAAARVRTQLLARLGGWNATILAGVVFLVVVGAAQLILPSVSETPPGFPPEVLYRFRLASLGISATLWLTIGLAFGAVAERLLSPGRQRHAVA